MDFLSVSSPYVSGSFFFRQEAAPVPIEIAIEIFRYAGEQTWIAAERVCRNWRDFTRQYGMNNVLLKCETLFSPPLLPLLYQKAGKTRELENKAKLIALFSQKRTELDLVLGVSSAKIFLDGLKKEFSSSFSRLQALTQWLSDYNLCLCVAQISKSERFHLAEIGKEVKRKVSLNLFDIKQEAQKIRRNLPQSDFIQLQSLNFSDLGLTELPVEIALFYQAQEINLARNHLHILPIEIGKLPQLRRLLLTHNRLVVLPDALRQLTLLQELYLSFNALETLPAVLGKMTTLRELYVSNNQLTHLSEDIWQLTNLCKLALSGNLLKELPQPFSILPHLEYLNLEDNPLSALPDRKFFPKLKKMLALTTVERKT